MAVPVRCMVFQRLGMAGSSHTLRRDPRPSNFGMRPTAFGRGLYRRSADGGLTGGG
jgi:hypothetical protein